MEFYERMFLGMLISCGLAMPAAASSRNYNKICEASAATLVDQSHVAIASDDYETILIYQRGQPQPVSRYDLGDDATDIEAAARIDDIIYWTTSHSLNKDGEDKKKRKLLFATRIKSDGTLSSEGKVYRNLRQDLALALNETEANLKVRFNIEGMTDTPDGHLLIGLRGPRTEQADEAILVEIGNPAELIASNAKDRRARVSRIVKLGLSDGTGATGRGIRDIARVGDRYLIVAGSEPDGGVPAPKLFWWDGKSDKATAGPDADFSGMTPEAVVVWNDHEAEIFSDNGGAVIDDAECGDKSPPANASFPALDVEF
ncbi:DUF3616 domain-containing protein [Pararhizobium gei]|uniref:DUF3616 domain-containing protein n=1 Tax=Pararhizobium gei TaxID=1395951 RepID=UPI0023D97B18|nr:DUF3616 domain-containing protein [Rhizobium gei]